VALKKIAINNDSEDELNAFVDEIKIMTTIAHPYLLSLMVGYDFTLYDYII
jgi:hypothetical protein